MKVALAILAILVSYASAGRGPCGGYFNIESCVCDDAESTEVNNPRMCKDVEAKVVSCTCADGSEWEPPCGGRENVVGCAPNEETGTIECTCADGTVFEPSGRGGRGGRGRGRGGRGRGRGRGGRGGNEGGNGDGDEGEDDEGVMEERRGPWVKRGKGGRILNGNESSNKST